MRITNYPDLQWYEKKKIIEQVAEVLKVREQVWKFYKEDDN